MAVFRPIEKPMRLARLVACAVVAASASVGLSLIAFVLVAIGPVFGMFAIYGDEAVMGAPGHGGAILFLRVPLAGLR